VTAAPKSRSRWPAAPKVLVTRSPPIPGASAFSDSLRGKQDAGLATPASAAAELVLATDDLQELLARRTERPHSESGGRKAASRYPRPGKHRPVNRLGPVDDAPQAVALARPEACPHALVERVRSQVSATGPDDRSALAVNGDREEPSGGPSLLEDWSMHTTKDVYVTGQAVREGQLQHGVAHNRDGADVRG